MAGGEAKEAEVAARGGGHGRALSKPAVSSGGRSVHVALLPLLYAARCGRAWLQRRWWHRFYTGSRHEVVAGWGRGCMRWMLRGRWLVGAGNARGGWCLGGGRLGQREHNSIGSLCLTKTT